MPAQVVLVLQDSAVLAALASAVEENGHTVQTFSDPMAALTALEQARSVELLITDVRFPPGKPNGRSLALMATMKRPGIKLLFLCAPEEEEHIADLGRCLSPPVDVVQVASLVEQSLAGSPDHVM